MLTTKSSRAIKTLLFAKQFSRLKAKRKANKYRLTIETLRNSGPRGDFFAPAFTASNISRFILLLTIIIPPSLNCTSSLKPRTARAPPARWARHRTGSKWNLHVEPITYHRMRTRTRAGCNCNFMQRDLLLWAPHEARFADIWILRGVALWSAAVIHDLLSHSDRLMRVSSRVIMRKLGRTQFHPGQWPPTQYFCIPIDIYRFPNGHC